MTVSLGAPDGSDQRPGSASDGPADSAERPHHPAPLSAREAIAATCPYLMSVGGAFRHATPNRDHRCHGLEPPAPQSTDKQRRHCLSPEHVDCPIFRAARVARATTLSLTGDPVVVAAIDGARRPIARTSPILLEQPRLLEQAVRLPFDRGPGQLALVGLMILAFVVVAITRLSSVSVPPPTPLPVPSSVARPSSSPTPVPTPPPTPSPAPSVSVIPASPEPSPRTTYIVKKGDTLISIAAVFNTTAAAIRQLNHLTSSTIHIGQVLKIP
jgi:LysM repeat protein